MGKSLIITEKPSVAREFARILGVSGRNDGYIEDSHYAITWCVGHLVEMVYPEEYDIKYKKWKLEDLPFLPKDYKYNVIPSVSKQYDIVHKLLHREDIDTVYWAGDAGKEGQTIEENIRRFGGVREGMKELRVWIDSQTEEEIKRGIAEARPMSDYDNLANSGIMRTIEDYAMGINFSRVMSVKYGNLLNDAAGTKSYTAIAVGRVMTCVLGMVVIREREIRNFVETPFYRVVGNFFDAEIEGEWKAVEGSSYYASPLLYKENGFKEKVHAEKLIKDLTNKTAIVKTVDKGISKKRAPLLFNLAELQAECSKRFKISPDETLQVAQDLYERKLTTYPRTDARVLSSAVAKEISKNIRGLRSFDPVAPFAQNIMEHGLYKNIGKSSYTDDSKITDHYAIVPTGQVNEYKSLTELQKRVYELIVRRFLSIFYPPAQYQTVKLTIGIEKESFFAGAKVLKVPGYLEIAGRPDTKEKREKEDGDGEENNPKNSAALLKLADSLKEGDAEEVKEFDKRIKHIKAVYDEYEKVKYTIPYSHFRTLAKGPKYYELLCDIELIIHIVADENTMNDIMDNIGNLTAIGRGEDFVEVLECAQTELFDVDEDVDYGEADFDVYMPVEYLEINKDDMDIISKTEGGYTGGTKYLMPKDYKTVQLKGGMRKRVFNRVPIIFCQLNYIENGCKGIMLDKTENGIYSVFLA